MEVRTIAVIGAGSLGRGIAQLAALAGYRTILEDILPASLRRAEGEIRASLHQITGRKEDAEQAISRLEYASTVEQAARQADLVIEAVPEELESKIEIFTLLDKVARPHTILASTTVQCSLADLASVTYRPSRCLGMRFAQPVEQAKLLEIVRAPDTAEETLAAGMELGRRMGTEVVVLTHQQLSGAG